jgi:hypothetical protein
MPQGLSGAGRAAHARARARAAFLSSAAQSLLRALLEREPGKRLGAGLQGSEAIMAHPFFRPISWARLLRREARQGPYALYPCRAAHCHAAPVALSPGRAATAAAERACGSLCREAVRSVAQGCAPASVGLQPVLCSLRTA